MGDQVVSPNALQFVRASFEVLFRQLRRRRFNVVAVSFAVVIVVFVSW